MSEGTITLPPDSTGKVTRTQTNAGVASGAHQPVVTPAGSEGNVATAAVMGSKVGLDVNIAGSAGGIATSAQTLSAASANVAGSANTTAMAVISAITLGNATVTLNTSAFVGTLAFEASDDGGTTYFPVAAAREDGTGMDVAPVFSIAAAYQRMWLVSLPGVTHFRVRCSAFTSGTAPIRISGGPFLIETNPLVSAVPLDGAKATYGAGHISGGGFAGALTGGVVWRLLGSATKLIKLTRLEVAVTIGGTSPTGFWPVVLRKASASTGGTTGSPLNVGPLDTADPAASAVSSGYTAAPSTTGTVTAMIRSWKQAIAAGTFQWAWDFGQGRPSKCPTLRGVNEELHLYQLATLGGTTPTATWTIAAEWTEENP